jgi:two-component system nitrogen regulation response regulator GlnG
MLQAAAISETTCPAPYYLEPTTPDREETSNRCAGSPGLAPRARIAVPSEAHPRPELRIVGVRNDSAEPCNPARLLLIDREPALVHEQLCRAFPAPAHRVQVAGTGRKGLEWLHADRPHVVVLDLGLSDQSALEVQRQIRRIDACIPVICLTGARRADAAIEAMKQGAHDCLFKPLDHAQLRQVVGEALDIARRVDQSPPAETAAPDADAEGIIIGSCPAMGEVYKAIGRVAAQDVPVLITGESGTGKELVARALHQHSRRAQAPFLALNCAAIPEALLESELFGHEQGAFTGADRKRVGKFEQCSGGTLFLDEVGDMPPALQAKLLRLLQEQAFERVGGNQTVRTDVRVIAATHRDLRAWSEEGKFRPDLYYRLGVFAIDLPPLRERGEDLPLLVRHFVRRFSRELGRQVREVAPEALERLRGHAWPGNVRELQSVLKQALLRASGTVLLPAFLSSEVGSQRSEVGSQRSEVRGQKSDAGDSLTSDLCSLTSDGGLAAFIRGRLGPEAQDLYAATHRQVDRVLLPRVLEDTGGNQNQAARLLGIARQTLRQKLRDLGLHVTHAVLGERAGG